MSMAALMIMLIIRSVIDTVHYDQGKQSAPRAFAATTTGRLCFRLPNYLLMVRDEAKALGPTEVELPYLLPITPIPLQSFREI